MSGSVAPLLASEAVTKVYGPADAARTAEAPAGQNGAGPETSKLETSKLETSKLETSKLETADLETRALCNVSLQIAAGEFVAIVGPSGCGKSTLLHLLAGLDHPTSGRVLLDGVDLATLDLAARAKLRRRRIGLVFQRIHLLANLTASENVQLPLAAEGASRRAQHERARELLAAVGLDQRAGHFPRALSGGEQQRVAIARALAAAPSVVLADEPTAALDSVAGRAVIDLLSAVGREQGRAVVLVTHDLELAARADRRVRLLDGQIVTEPSPATLSPATLSPAASSPAEGSGG